MRALALLIATALAAASPAAGQRDTLVLQDCTIRQGIFPLPYDEAQRLMPAGLTAATYLNAHGAASQPVPLFGELDVGFVTCASGSIGGHTVDDASFMLVAVMVEGPAGPSDPVAYTVNALMSEHHHYGLALGAVAAGNDLRNLFRQWGLDEVERGTFTATASVLGSFDSTSSAGGVVGMRETPTAPAHQHDEVYRFYFAEDGEVVGGMDLFAPETDIYGGGGSLDIAAHGGWLAQLPAHLDGVAGGVDRPGWSLEITSF